ncbi:hypothetical protein [Paracidovorax cattleyae]|uniref:hypothetical protein n=1 Tax=Paracidovorax cattleyae TaxID=80868 RepID=UPI0018AFE3EF|nr:hypothetical protein [Paracidovorax cattleyae]MBF9263580.1 hypothetical protein [Paracidovorax cattleyae]
MSTATQMTPSPTIDPADEARENALWDQRCGVLHKAWVQVRYHRYRQRFFDLADKLTKAATIVLGASLLGQYAKNIPWIATAITSLGFVALVFAYGDRKQTHKELAEQASKLVGDIERVTLAELSPARTAAWTAEYVQLCAKAPPPLKTLTLICEREQSAADGHPNHVPLQPFYRRWLCHFFS